MPDDWDALFPAVGSTPTAMPPSAAFPGVIPGRPKPIDQFKVRDQELQEEAARRAAEDQARQDEKATRERLEWNAKFNPDGTPRPGVGDGKVTEAERTAGFLATRLYGASRQIGEAGKGNFAALQPGIGTELVRRVAGDTPANYLTGSDRQVVEGAQIDLLDSALTLGTGAAYTREQLEGYRKAYFPQLGDSGPAIEAKQERLKVLLEAARLKAGNAAPQIDKAIQAVFGTAQTTTTNNNQDDDPAIVLGDPGIPEGSTIVGDRIVGPDGRDIGPSPAAIDRMGGTPPPDQPPPSGGNRYSLDNIALGLAQGTGDLVQGVGDLVGIVGNPLNATINAVAGTNLSTDLGEALRTDLLGLPRNSSRTAEMINRGGVAALTGSLVARGAAAALSPGNVRGALSAFGATPGRDMLAGAGAGGGGEVGRQVGGTPGQVVGTLAGGLAGYASPGALSRVGGPRTPSPLLQKADDLGVTMMPADVGGVGTRMATGGVGRTLGGIPIAEGAQKSIGSAAAARGRIASDIGDATDNVGAGQAVKRGFKQFERSSAERGGQLFEKVSVPAKSEVQLGQTRNALAEVTRGMQSNPALSRLWANHPRLRATLEALTPEDPATGATEAFRGASQRLQAAKATLDEVKTQIVSPDAELRNMARSQLAAAEKEAGLAEQAVEDALNMAAQPPDGGQLSWEDMKRFRSIVGEIVGQPGVTRDGSDIAALRKLYAAVTSDMEVTAAKAGPRALQEFRRASQYWRGREDRIEEVFSALLGKDGNRSEEGVFKQINSWAKGENGDFSRLARTIRSMPADEANIVRSTLVQRMGMAKPANQDATQEVFSPALFSTEWRGLSSRAKNVLFPNKQHRADLEKLAEITDGMKRADQFQNFSNTALGVNVTGQGALALANLPAAVTLAGMQFGAGKLLASPRFARIIASSADMPPERAGRKIVEQLGVLATREPLLRADAKALQAHLQQALGQSPVRAAANEKEQD